jgi:hypothetical protein
MNWIGHYCMTLFFIIAGLWVGWQLFVNVRAFIRHNRREANRAALDLWCDAPEMERAQFERML